MRSDFDTRFIQLLLVAVIVLLTKDDSMVWRVVHPIFIVVCAAAWAAVIAKHRTDVAKECIEAGGGYSESWLRRRPKCKLPRHQ